MRLKSIDSGYMDSLQSKDEVIIPEDGPDQFRAPKFYLFYPCLTAWPIIKGSVTMGEDSDALVYI